MSQAKLANAFGNDVDQKLLIRDHLSCFLQKLSRHMAQGRDGADCFRRELKNDRHPGRKSGWGKLRGKHAKNEWGFSKCSSSLSSPNAFTIYALVSGNAMLLSDSGAQNFDRFMSGVHVGLVGFEPTASWSRTRRSTKLSHSPKWIKHATMPNRRARYFAYVAAYSKEIEPGRV